MVIEEEDDPSPGEVLIPEAFEPLFATTADDGGPVRYRAFHGGRGSAKTHSFGRALIVKQTQRPLMVGIYREIQKSIRDSIKRLLDQRIDAFVAANPGFRGFFTSTDTEIRTAKGGLFVFGGLRTNPEAIKSTEGLDIAVVIEANKVAQVSWDLLIPTVRNDGSEIWAEWNPDQEKDPVDAMFRGKDGPPPGTILREVSFEDNPFFPDVLQREMDFARRRDPDKYQWVWRGGYRRNSEARVFRNWREESFETPSNAVFRQGADWGFATDPTVLVRCFIGRWENGVAIPDEKGRHLFIDYEAYEVGCEIDKTPQLFDSVPHGRRWQITADSARPETISYMKRNGYPKIVAAIKGPGSLEDGVEFLKAYDIIVHPRCVHVIDELTLYSYKTDPLTGKVLPELQDKKNHTIDACRYALEGARRAGGPPKPDADDDRGGEPEGEYGWMAG